MDLVLTLQREMLTAWRGEIATEKKRALENCECWVPGRKSQVNLDVLVRKKEISKKSQWSRCYWAICQETKKGIMICEVTKLDTMFGTITCTCLSKKGF